MAGRTRGRPVHGVAFLLSRRLDHAAYCVQAKQAQAASRSWAGTGLVLR